MGYRNQMDTITKALLLGILTNRSVCLPYFNSDFREAPDIQPQHFIDFNATNNNLAKLHSHGYTATTITAPIVMTTTDPAKKKCKCLLLQGEGAPAGVRRCAYGGAGTVLVRSVDANYTNLLDFIRRPQINQLPSLCMSPGMPFNEPIRAQHQPLLAAVQAAVAHPSVFTSIANFVKVKEGICKGACTGEEVYLSTHPRLENDFIIQLQMLSGFYQKRGINANVNNAIIDSFLHDFQKFLDEIFASVDVVHISTGLGKTEDNVNNFLVKNYYEKRFKSVSSYHYEYMEQVMSVARHTNHSSHFLTDAPDIPDPHNVSHHISKEELIEFHHIISGVHLKKSRLRDLHAVVDFTLAAKAASFYGVCDSTFTQGLRSLVKVSACYAQNVTYLQSLTPEDFRAIALRVDSLRRGSMEYIVNHTSSDTHSF
jgi:hypothetical protein